MNYHFYSRKKKKLKRLLKKLNTTSKNTVQFKKLILKIKKVSTDLKRWLSLPELRKVLGPAAVFLGLSLSNVNAQQFDVPVSNAFGAGINTGYFFMPATADLDGDGDLDLMGGTYNGILVYQRNSGTAALPSFDPPLANQFGLTPTVNLAFPEFVDLDNDGDFDLLVGEYYGAFKYFENIGTASVPQFAPPQSNPFGLSSTVYFNDPDIVDIDGDGDFDIISGDYYGFKYFENTGTATNPQFGAQVTNPFGLMPTYNAYYFFSDLADWDMDGDMDLITTEYYGDFVYYENTGTATAPQFAASVNNPFNLIPQSYFGFPTSNDMDGDGDLDILFGTYSGSGLEYYENLAFPVNTDNDGDGFPNTVDCNDADPNTYPGAPEICDGKDNNCDMVIDEGLPQNTYYADTDNDGFGDPNASIQDCSVNPPQGYVTDKTDCDDNNSFVFPGAVEICDGLDNNCDGDIDEGVSYTHYLDADSDGYGDPASSIVDCNFNPPTNYVSNADDCDDGNANVNPGATEICDGLDNNCDGTIDEGVTYTHYLDADGDSYGDLANPLVDCNATPPANYVSNSDDCDDSNPNINPGATDIPNNGIDEDCDGMDSTTTANENQATAMGLQVFPNPTASLLTIVAQTDETVSLSIFDQTGKLISIEQQATLKNGKTINVDGFAEGIYLLKLQDKDGRVGTKRFTVIRN